MNLTHYHTFLTFNDPEEESFRKHCGERRKCWSPAFSPFPTMFSTFSKSVFYFLVTFNLSSANAFNLDQSKNFWFGERLYSNHTNLLVLKTLRRGQKMCGWSEGHLLADKLISNLGRKKKMNSHGVTWGIFS